MAGYVEAEHESHAGATAFCWGFGKTEGIFEGWVLLMLTVFISPRSLRCAELVEVILSKCVQFSEFVSGRIGASTGSAGLDSDRWHAELVEVLSRLDSDRLRAWVPAFAGMTESL